MCAKDILCELYDSSLACSRRRANPGRRPKPDMLKEIGEVGEIRLAGGRANNGLDRDTEERQCEN